MDEKKKKYLKKIYEIQGKVLDKIKLTISKKNIIAYFFFVIWYFLWHIFFVQHLDWTPWLLLKENPLLPEYFLFIVKIISWLWLYYLYKFLSTSEILSQYLGESFFSFETDETTDILMVLFFSFLLAFIVKITIFS